MASSSCSHWWHAPIYITISIVLAIVAITTSSHSNPKSQTLFSSSSNTTNQLLTNASLSLRNSGFTFMATLFQISPELFLSSSSSSQSLPTTTTTTLFAIHDKALMNISVLLPSYLMKQLLHYHTSPSKLSLNHLLNQTQGTCLPTLLHAKNLSITKINTNQRFIEINGVLISQPDLFIQEEGFLTIHGVNAPFFSINAMETVQQHEQDWGEFIRSPVCGTETRNKIQWNQLLRMLSSKGYVSFAIGLRSVLDRILNEYSDLDSVTIFAPMDFTYIASSSSPMLERIVRFHIMPQGLSYNELVSMPLKTSLRTLSDGNGLEITEKGILGISINGVKITAPDVLSTKELVVHGISQPFTVATFS
ncbi:hypothetical protein AQUCO_00400610v1 [Aquilegia coerulea]|uniref:FAS1 domain-containing protein n=1 Tax=Aquilegia coerulea TaxID=218851 RepID=A0A2G5EVW3_AQUCA|nr:hypothetical protein AQUCO_00400610v1 [Aquilegia coerulea]